MALRRFSDSEGRSWDVWDVVPDRVTPSPYAQRRFGDRRCPDPVLLYKGPERRVAERRWTASRSPLGAPGMEHGWLVFVCDGVKRRLAPPPEGWERYPEGELERLLARAR